MPCECFHSQPGQHLPLVVSGREGLGMVKGECKKIEMEEGGRKGIEGRYEER